MVKSVLDTTRTDGGRRDEIFVDIVEKLTCTFNSSGYLQASQIDGAIVVRSPPHEQEGSPWRGCLKGQSRALRASKHAFWAFTGAFYAERPTERKDLQIHHISALHWNCADH